MTTNKKRHSH